METLITLLFDRNFVAIGATVLGVFAFGLLAWVASAIEKDSRLSKYAKAWEMARTKAVDMIITIRTEGVDLSDVNGINYNELSETSLEKYGRYVDPRMLYTLDEVDTFIQKTAHVELDAIDIITNAERLYQEIRAAANGLVMNDKDVATNAIPPTPEVVEASTAPTELEPVVKEVASNTTTVNITGAYDVESVLAELKRRGIKIDEQPKVETPEALAKAEAEIEDLLNIEDEPGSSL